MLNQSSPLMSVARKRTVLANTFRRRNSKGSVMADRIKQVPDKVINEMYQRIIIKKGACIW